MSISIRDSICWLPDTASEPTTTIVLTSPERRFVDIRILKDASEQSSLDWAFAGTSSSSALRNGVRHSTWRHVVDSRTRTPESVVDEGDILPQSDGRTLETGRMTNPATGKMTDYEEIWTDLEVEESEEANKTPGNPTAQPRARCVVLELHDEEREERGMVVYVDRYCQGVVRIGDAFAAERWMLEDGKWERKNHVGDLWIPGPEHICRTTLALGEEVCSEDGLQKWRVAEISRS
ncbi:hypothetical protein GGR50DRAFT_452128 [Xylaria sp. CBS 124048]|nr:hypothetical protein GGR50DRAFT_452128 [Xylaria sp. CBS 124048]